MANLDRDDLINFVRANFHALITVEVELVREELPYGGGTVVRANYVVKIDGERVGSEYDAASICL